MAVQVAPTTPSAPTATSPTAAGNDLLIGSTGDTLIGGDGDASSGSNLTFAQLSGGAGTGAAVHGAGSAST
jgi:hypothetical protein